MKPSGKSIETSSTSARCTPLCGIVILSSLRSSDGCFEGTKTQTHI